MSEFGVMSSRRCPGCGALVYGAPEGNEWRCLACKPDDDEQEETTMPELPEWAQFDENEYENQTEDLNDWDTGGIECECNDNIEEIAAHVLAYRYEIVRLRAARTRQDEAARAVVAVQARWDSMPDGPATFNTLNAYLKEMSDAADSLKAAMKGTT